MSSIYPKKLDVNKVRQDITTRKDFNNLMSSLDRFSKRGAEKIVSMENVENNIRTTQWQFDEMKRMEKTINRERKKYKEWVDKYDKYSDLKGNAMGSIDSNNFKPVNITTNKMTQTDFNKKFESFNKESGSRYWENREEAMKDSYIKGIRQNYREEDVEDLIEYIENMDSKEFYEKYLQAGQDFEYLYYDSEEQYQAYLTQLRATWLPITKAFNLPKAKG